MTRKAIPPRCPNTTRGDSSGRDLRSGFEIGLAQILALLDDDPIANCMVAARVESLGSDAEAIADALWVGPHGGICYREANLLPVAGDAVDLRYFAQQAIRAERCYSTMVGPAGLVLPLWDFIAPYWPPAREIRKNQPLLALKNYPKVPSDPLVRRVTIDDFDEYLVAAIDMFTTEVGVDPCARDGGRAYRRRIAHMIAAGRAFARFDGKRVIFKAEIGARSRRVGQIHGVWVAPDRRGEGLSVGATATVSEAIQRSGRIPSLYVNDFNVVARRSYARIGFEQVGAFATVLMD